MQMFSPGATFFSGFSSGSPPNQTEMESPAGILASKRGRQSKIHTAHGTRDRRMRLSREIARMFFDLQDKLGFERASKTVEWLFVNSGSAIADLYRAHNSSSFQTPPSYTTEPPPRRVASSRKTTLAMKREKAKERTREKRRAEESILMGQNKDMNGSNSMLDSQAEDGNMNMNLQDMFLSCCESEQVIQNNEHDLVLMVNGVQVQQQFPEVCGKSLWWV